MSVLGQWIGDAPRIPFQGTTYRIVPARYRDSPLSMLGAYLHGARYNPRGVFDCLYTSLDLETAWVELERYFTVPPRGGFLRAVIGLRLSRVLDLTDETLLRQAGAGLPDLISTSYEIPRALGVSAWTNGIEGLLIPSAARLRGKNLAVLLDNQGPGWRLHLRRVDAVRPGSRRASYPSR